MFTLLHELPDQFLYGYGSLLVNVHWDELRLHHLGIITDVCDGIVKRHDKLTSIIVLRGNVNVDLSAETRTAAANLTARFEKGNNGQAIIIEADGFRASLARSVITGINLFARSRASQRVFQNPKEATEWLCTLPTQPPDLRNQVDGIWTAFEKILRDRKKGKPANATPPSP